MSIEQTSKDNSYKMTYTANSLKIIDICDWIMIDELEGGYALCPQKDGLWDYARTDNGIALFVTKKDAVDAIKELDKRHLPTQTHKEHINEIQVSIKKKGYWN